MLKTSCCNATEREAIDANDSWACLACINLNQNEQESLDLLWSRSNNLTPWSPRASGTTTLTLWGLIRDQVVILKQIRSLVPSFSDNIHSLSTIITAHTRMRKQSFIIEACHMPCTVVGCHLLCLGSCLARGVVLQLSLQTYHRLLSAFWHFYNQCLFNSFRQVIWLECESKVSIAPFHLFKTIIKQLSSGAAHSFRPSLHPSDPP